MVALTTALAALTGDIAIGTEFLKTADGGIAVKMVNKTGSASVKGSLVRAGATVANSFVLCEVDVPVPIGVVYEAGVTDANACWVTIAGKAYVLLTNAAASSGYVRVGTAADTGEQNGQGVWEATPSSPFATDNHFREIGHNLEITAAAGLVLCAVHFN